MTEDYFMKNHVKQKDRTMIVRIIDRCDNFYQMQNVSTGELFGERYSFRNSAVEAAVKAGYAVITAEQSTVK